MKIAAFHTLHTVIATGSLAKAAQALNLTPSAVSMQMKQLEDYMGTALFDRSGQAIRPVPLAHEIATIMEEALARVEALRERPDVRVQGTVRLGIVDTMLPLLLPRTLSALQQRHPLLNVDVDRGKSRALTQRIRSAELDLAVLALPPQEPQAARGLVWQPLLQRDFVLLAPSSAKEKTVKALLAAHRLIGYDRSTVTGQLASRYLADKYGIRKLDMEFDSIPAIISMVGLGMGVALLQIADPRLLQADPVRTLALPADAPRMQYALLLRQADRDKRNLQALVQVLADVARDTG
ncbi:LysR family transcriptional regulator [Comamonas endophytica]|uniref:LysR family transcriptional regulator n=1 Tax=Comamonas endophytica TaxID=2949090 RepID=A0ABY6G7M3_9BURK|nr:MULTISPECIES: LysR family transcriptional regulator [unclassified Acidovorax]MCD2511660.1 LysR family transcriptional regulator [Acidovorax sp. D4N7]UYG51041.1 LysR family transcriptional regulator [Acidovorax sp. 5MLIR]